MQIDRAGAVGTVIVLSSQIALTAVPSSPAVSFGAHQSSTTYIHHSHSQVTIAHHTSTMVGYEWSTTTTKPWTAMNGSFLTSPIIFYGFYIDNRNIVNLLDLLDLIYKDNSTHVLIM